MTYAGVTRVVGPVEEIITIEEVKARLDIVRTDQDLMIASLIKGAVERIDGPNAWGLALMSQTWRRTLDQFERQIDLPGYPVQSVNAVTYRDASGSEQVLDPQSYFLASHVEPAQLVIRQAVNLPDTDPEIGAVWVDYGVGYGDRNEIPGPLIDAIALLIGHRYENREAAIVGTISNELPLGYTAIMRDYARHRVTA
ncbi:MAG: hypothetical protein AAFW47_08430 [Pseudomonadota bacterium]